MITQFRFQNFKAWESFGPVRFAPLTVLFGSNSSGKSSVAQFLLMLKQTVESQDKKMVFNIGGVNTAVDLGNFYEVVFQHEEARKVSFQLDWTLAKALELEDQYGKKNYLGSTMRFSAEAGLVGVKSPVLGIHSMNYVLGNPASNGMEVGMRRTDKPNHHHGTTGDPSSPISANVAGGFIHRGHPFVGERCASQRSVNR